MIFYPVITFFYFISIICLFNKPIQSNQILELEGVIFDSGSSNVAEQLTSGSAQLTARESAGTKGNGQLNNCQALSIFDENVWSSSLIRCHSINFSILQNPIDPKPMIAFRLSKLLYNLTAHIFLSLIFRILRPVVNFWVRSASMSNALAIQQLKHFYRYTLTTYIRIQYVCIQVIY